MQYLRGAIKDTFGKQKLSKFNVPGWNERTKKLNGRYREAVIEPLEYCSGAPEVIHYSDSLIIISHKSVYDNVILAFCVQHSINNQ